MPTVLRSGPYRLYFTGTNRTNRHTCTLTAMINQPNSGWTP